MKITLKALPANDGAPIRCGMVFVDGMSVENCKRLAKGLVPNEAYDAYELFERRYTMAPKLMTTAVCERHHKFLEEEL